MKKVTTRLLLIIIVLALAMLACVGGGGNGSLNNTWTSNGGSILEAPDATAAYGAEQLQIQLTAMADESQVQSVP